MNMIKNMNMRIGAGATARRKHLLCLPRNSPVLDCTSLLMELKYITLSVFAIQEPSTPPCVETLQWRVGDLSSAHGAPPQSPHGTLYSAVQAILPANSAGSDLHSYHAILSPAAVCSIGKFVVKVCHVLAFMQPFFSVQTMLSTG